MSRTPMKLILTQEVSGLGGPGDVVDVAAGYGRNYLIPRGFAVTWTRGAEKQIELIKRARSAREIRGLEDAKAVAAQLDGLHVRMRRRAGGSGRLFGSVGPADIAAAGREAGGPELDRRRIEGRDPIKTAGTHQGRGRPHPEARAPRGLEIPAGSPVAGWPVAGLSPSSGAGVSPAPLACVRRPDAYRTPAGRRPTPAGRLPDLADPCRMPAGRRPDPAGRSGTGVSL